MHRKNIDAAFIRTWDYLKYNEACMCLKHNILNRVKWLFEDFAYYAREDDEEVPIGCIGNAIKEGVVSIDEMTEIFRETLTNYYKANKI
mgnify:CR=1 FL=1